MITRKQKIDFLVNQYKNMVKYSDFDTIDYGIENQIIIDSVGISGLKEIKKRVWSDKVER